LGRADRIATGNCRLWRQVQWIARQGALRRWDAVHAALTDGADRTTMLIERSLGGSGIQDSQAGAAPVSAGRK
jgi:hypothetical protein